MKIKKLILVAMLMLTLTANAGEIVQGFVNPSFGGNPNNGPVLLNEANAINKFKAPVVSSSSSISSSSSSTTTGAPSQFAITVDNLVQSAIASRLVTQALGPSSSTPLTTNSIDTGVNTITITSLPNNVGTQVTIVNDLTGAKSIITVPMY
jgi:curli production assembly/transport component CsgF